MRYEKLEKAIVKIDNEIAAMNIAKKYLSNVDEINDVKEELNQKRQLLANDLYSEDHKAYGECLEVMREIVDKELSKYDQMELLDTIKEKYGRKSPNVSKNSYGLNAWLKELDIEYSWIENEGADWATLVITGFGVHKYKQSKV